MKWLGVVAMAALIAGSCSPKSENALISDTSAAPASESAAVVAPSIEGLPAGDYKLDPTHSTLLFSASHLGFSNYTAQFTSFSADLKLDPANPGDAVLTASVDPASLWLPSPPAGFVDEIKGTNWIDASQFPQITFQSTTVNAAGENTANVAGNLTLHGVTKPVMLEVVFNGGYAGHQYEPNARLGFSARGTFKRSDFGIAYGIPAPGSSMGVSDEVKVMIEAEFTGPPWKDAPAVAPAATPPAN